MFNLPDMSKLAESAKEIQARQAKIDEKKIEVLQRIEAKLDRILEALKKG